MKTNQMQHHEVSLSKWVQSILTLDGKPYSLADRGYTLPFFDNGYSELLMCCARQTEKTVSVEQLVSLDNGRLIRAGDVLIGHHLAALDMDQLKASRGEVTWRSRVYRKPCIRIKTRLGLEMDIATTHPVLTFNGWVEGGELAVGTRVAAMSRVGEFTGSYQCDDECVAALAEYPDVIPDCVYDLSREQTALFLNRIWQAHGASSDSGAECVADSRAMAAQLQAILWKFEIQSSIEHEASTGEAYIVRIGPGKFQSIMDSQEGSGAESGEIVWDGIISIDPLGELDCVDFTVSPHNNFITGGIVTHNSTMLAAMAMGWMTAFPNFNVLYGCPDLKKVRQWSHDKVRPFFSSPKITLVTGGAPIQSNVEVKSLANGSTLYIRNSDPDGDNFRGVSVGAVLADEVQDMVGKAIIVAEEALSHSPWPIKFKRYSGTPKSLDNTIEALWRRSTQTEWLVRCPHCSKSDSCYNNLGIENISPAGLICSRCKNPIDARTGRWVHSYPQRYLKGFRISQIMVPWTDFAEVYYNKLATYSTALFMNEVLGISYESGAKYLTMDEVQQVCAESGEYDMTLELDKEAKSHRRVAGVDWGVSAEGGATTVVTIAVCIRPDKIKIIYCRRLPPAMPLDEQTEAVQDILAKYKVDYVCADKGAAGDRNLHLAHVVGASNILQVHFTGSGTLTKKFFEDIAQLNLNRVMALSDFRTEFTRRRHFLLPKWEVWEPFAQDMLTQIVETDSGGNLLYNHPAGTLDDVLMSLVYVNVARKMVYGMPLISTIPNSTFLQAKIARD